jgi:hypothetical protein
VSDDGLQPLAGLTALKVTQFYKMLHWINRIVLLSLEPLVGELQYANVEWFAAGAWASRVSMYNNGGQH